MNPLTQSQFSALMTKLAPFETSPTLAVALSGGIDSMALTLLTHEWASSQGGKIIALSVDHRLRPESTQEAELVAGWCKNWGIEQHTVTWDAPVAIQSSARDARYQLLTDYCKQHHILHLLTAHHQNDQVETFFFRLARGSGLSGLACMAAVSDVLGVRLLRPLLETAKSQLQATLLEKNHPWVEDPSNAKPVYTRNNIRLNLAKTEDFDDISKRTVLVSNRLSSLRNLLEYELVSCLTNGISIYPEGYGTLQYKVFAQMPPELAVSTLSSLITTLSGDATIARNEKLQRLYQSLLANPTVTKRSFGGVLFHYKAALQGWLIYREPHATQGVLKVPAQLPMLWDKRFRVNWHASSTKVSEFNVQALGARGMQILAKYHAALMRQHKLAKQKMLLAALPSFWHLDELVAIPHINYVHDAYKHVNFTARFTPRKPLAGRSFFGMNTSHDYAQHVPVEKA